MHSKICGANQLINIGKTKNGLDSIYLENNGQQY